MYPSRSIPLSSSCRRYRRSCRCPRYGSDVARLGGGTVRVLPGTFTLRNAIHLPTGIRLVGSGGDSILTKAASATVALSAESDWYDQEITLSQPKDLRVGDGVLLRAKNPHHGGDQVIKRTLIARSGNRFKLDDGLQDNLWLSGDPTCSSLFPLLTSNGESDVVIENITLDGNKQNNENLNGNHGGCIFVQTCNRFTIRNVEARNDNGDGISFQVCHDVVVQGCHSHDNANLDGVTIVVTDSEIPRVVAVNLLGESVSASAAIVDAEIFHRGDRHLVCIAQDGPQACVVGKARRCVVASWVQPTCYAGD